MKKIIGLSVILCMLVAVLAMSAYAAPTLLWEFGTDTGIEDNMGANSLGSVTYAAEDFYHIFTATGGDPYVSVDLSADDVSQVAWVKARVLNKSSATAIELFGATDGRGLSGPECTHIDILPNSAEWQTVIVNVPASNVATANAFKNPAEPLTETYWTGTVEWIRLDPMWHIGDDGLDAGGSMLNDEQIYIDYIAFFATEADAIAYVGAAEQAVVEVPAETEAAETAAAETAAAEVVEEAPAAAQTSDIASIAVIAVVLALGTAYAVSKKR
ncbi:MAG: hypothetical protein ACYCWE_20820 [Eubacteriales bacterium]